MRYKLYIILTLLTIKTSGQQFDRPVLQGQEFAIFIPEDTCEEIMVIGDTIKAIKHLMSEVKAKSLEIDSIMTEYFNLLNTSADFANCARYDENCKEWKRYWKILKRRGFKMTKGYKANKCCN